MPLSQGNQIFNIEHLSFPLDLNHDEIREISMFMFIWSFFEASKFNADANIPALIQYAEGLELNRTFNPNLLGAYLYYLQGRYASEGQLNGRFARLKVSSGMQGLVKEVLLGDTSDYLKQIKCCLVIIYRLRNNLFHGDKWQYGLSEQLANFSEANRFLNHCIEVS